MSHDFDLIVIGGGSGGLACVKRAASYGARIALFEREHLGGTCVNRGCVPKKLLWEAAEHTRAQSRFQEMEIGSANGVDYAKLSKLSAAKIERLRQTFEEELENAGVTVIRDEAALNTPSEVAYDGRVLTAGRVVIATGAAPIVPQIEGGDLAATSNDVFRWRTLPERLVIVGGGYIGCEFASIFSAFGVDVTLVTSGERILGGFDSDAIERVHANLVAAGVKIRTGVRLEAVHDMGNMRLTEFDDGTESVAERVLLATGRAPNLDVVRKLSEPPKTTETGTFAVNDRLETSVRGVHAIGDAADRMPLTPVATRDGEALADILFGAGGEIVALDHVAKTAFVHPPVAQVGRMNGTGTTNETESAPLGAGVLLDHDTAPKSYAKSVTDPETGELSGLALVGDGAGEMIALAATLLAAGGQSADLRAATAVHPSFAEEFVGR